MTIQQPNHSEQSYAVAIAAHLGFPSAPPPEEPVVCIRPSTDGTTLAVVRYDPQLTTREDAESIVRTSLLDSKPREYGWQIWETPTTPDKVLRKSAPGAGLGAAAAVLVQPEINGVMPIIVAGFVAAIITAATFLRKQQSAQGEAAAEIIRRISNYAPRHDKITSPEIIHKHDQGVTVMAFPPGQTQTS